MKWPNKSEREDFEIKGFIEAYARLLDTGKFEIVNKGETPDYIVKDIKTGEQFGVELTSVYMDDRSVPDVHMRDEEGIVEIPYDKEELERYSKRLIAAINDKVCKARNPLILAIYVNEYIAIYLGKSELEGLVQRYEGVFDSVHPFTEVVFWNLGNGGVFRVRPVPIFIAQLCAGEGRGKKRRAPQLVRCRAKRSLACRVRVPVG